MTIPRTMFTRLFLPFADSVYKCHHCHNVAIVNDSIARIPGLESDFDLRPDAPTYRFCPNCGAQITGWRHDDDDDIDADTNYPDHDFSDDL